MTIINISQLLRYKDLKLQSAHTDIDAASAHNACECVHLWTCAASLWGSRALPGGPSAAGSPWPQRWASGRPGSPSPRPETRSHRGGSTGWWEAAGCVRGPSGGTNGRREIWALLSFLVVVEDGTRVNWPFQSSVCERHIYSATTWWPQTPSPL